MTSRRSARSSPKDSTIQFFIRKTLSQFAWLELAFTFLAILELIKKPGITSLALVLFVLYFFPVLVYRFIAFFYPIEEGYSYLTQGKHCSPWHNGYKIQLFYVSFPALEAALRLIPEAYPAWLRLWGSKVEKKVYFTPGATVMDRTHLELGDGCFIGNRAYLSPHVIRVKNGKNLLYLKRIKIGKGAFIGFDSRIGPGVTIGDGVSVPGDSDLFINEIVESDAYFL